MAVIDQKSWPRDGSLAGVSSHTPSGFPPLHDVGSSREG